ncbi:MAG TPA: pyridoxamine 5'-phosphate oxidase family protein, partial [Pseudomonadales bacterium]|nr:pyridoxamine 5'-phosphate oxidase family protein [Pseudomonadales bacterium]
MISIDPLRNCFEGAIPASLTTVALDGTPNIAWLSQVQYVDNSHVALTYQFFNKTRANILQNPHGILTVIDPETGA